MIISTSSAARTGITAIKISEIWLSILNETIMANTSMTGPRIAILISI